MKKSSVLMIAAALMLASCGTIAQYASSDSGHRFQDGIYGSAPDFVTKEEKTAAKAETEALVEKTKASQIYLFGEKKDTVMIPESMSASIRYDKTLGSTVVTVGENPYDWQNYVNPWAYYTPYSIGSSWYWSRHYDPWYWNAWAYTPHRYYGWYDPFYYGGWYDPWYYGYGGYYGHYGYYGYAGWYSPWYGYMNPYYCGWYGGWDPYWGHHHHHVQGAPVKDEDRWQGPRRYTGSERVFASRVSTRSGGGGSSRTSRGTVAQSAGRQLTSASASGRTSVSRTSSAAPARTSVSRASSSVREQQTSSPSTTKLVNGTKLTDGSRNVVRQTTATVSGKTVNYRKPTGTVAGSTVSETRPAGSVSSYREQSGSSSYRGSSTSGTSTYRGSAPASTTRSSSSYSGGFSGGGSRSSGSYSGGASRSSGSTGSRR